MQRGGTQRRHAGKKSHHLALAAITDINVLVLILTNGKVIAPTLREQRPLRHPLQLLKLPTSKGTPTTYFEATR